MLRTVGWLLWMFGYMLTRIPITWKAKRLSKKGHDAEAREIVAWEVLKWAEKFLRHIKVNVEVEGLENMPAPDEKVVFIANHQSYLDVPVLITILKPLPAAMVKKELGQVPIMGTWIRRINCVFVDRKDPRSGMEALRQAQQVLDAGRSFALFPEGTRSKSDVMGEFQAGAAHIAVKAGVPIIPIAVDGSYKGLEGNGFRFRPANVRVVVLPRVETQRMTRKEQKALPEQLAETIRKAKDRK